MKCRGGTRTRTELSLQRILSPLRMPFSPPVASKNSERAGKSRVFRSAAVESPACLSSSDPSSRLLPADSVVGCLWSWRICQSASSPDVALKEKGPSPFGPAPHLTPRPTYFLRFVFVARAADP